MTVSYSLSADRARAIVERFPSLSVLVVGDVMLDHFVVGRVSRISPEAPVPVVEVKRDNFLLGGCANVLNNIHAIDFALDHCGFSRVWLQVFV